MEELKSVIEAAWERRATISPGGGAADAKVKDAVAETIRQVPVLEHLQIAAPETQSTSRG